MRGPVVGASPCGIVYIMDVEPKDCDVVMKSARNAAEYLSKNVPGFIEARLLASNDGTTVIAYAAWETRHDWSQAQWAEVVQRATVDFHGAAKKIEFKFFGRREVIDRQSG
jgi:heme-degrading monooxygenase HmoA